MKRDQPAPGAFATRRRGYSSAQDSPNKLVQSSSQKDLDIKFTTKYIDTLNDLQRLEDENKRLMLRMRSLEAQIVPASKNSQHTYIKMIAPACLEYHQEERKLNRALQDENEMLRRQFQNSTNAAAEANEKKREALNKIKLLELEIVGKVDEARQGTQTQYTLEIKKLQESLVDLERRWGIEKKQLTMERDSYALQCESLKVDATSIRIQRTEWSKNTNRDSMIMEGFDDDDDDGDYDDDHKRSPFPVPDVVSSKKMEPSISHEILFDQFRGSERRDSARPPSSYRATSPSHPSLRAFHTPTPSRPSSTTRPSPSQEGEVESTNPTSTAQLENELWALTTKYKELQKVVEQQKYQGEETAFQNTKLAAEVKQLNAKLRLMTSLDRFSSRPESASRLPVMLRSSIISPPLSSVPLTPPVPSASPLLSASVKSSSSKNIHSELPLDRSRPPTGRLRKEKLSSSIPYPSPPASPWDTGPASVSVSGQKISSIKRSLPSK